MNNATLNVEMIKVITEWANNKGYILKTSNCIGSETEFYTQGFSKNDTDDFLIQKNADSELTSMMMAVEYIRMITEPKEQG